MERPRQSRGDGAHRLDELGNLTSSQILPVGGEVCVSSEVSFFFFLIYLLILCKYIVAVFRHSRRGSQISLRMVVSHHVVAGI